MIWYTIMLISGFDYNFTDYDCRRTLQLFKQHLARGVNFHVSCCLIQGFLEIIVGESIVKSPYKEYLKHTHSVGELGEHQAQLDEFVCALHHVDKMLLKMGEAIQSSRWEDSSYY